jgi:hypothetical protein
MRGLFRGKVDRAAPAFLTAASLAVFMERINNETALRNNGPALCAPTHGLLRVPAHGLGHASSVCFDGNRIALDDVDAKTLDSAQL